jgi:hypothetical protein
MTLELMDQMVRVRSGGDVLQFLSKQPLRNEAFVLERWGTEAKTLLGSLRGEAAHNGDTQNASPPQPRSRASQRYWRACRERLLKWMLGPEYDALQAGRFRSGGEIHQWMYDRYSLRVALERAGLHDVVERGPLESYVAQWSDFCLDTEPNGATYKPDSLYMEARKE